MRALLLIATSLLLVIVASRPARAAEGESEEGKAPSRPYITSVVSLGMTSLGLGGSASVLGRLHYARVGLVGEAMGTGSNKSGGGLVLGVGSKRMNRPIVDVLVEGGVHSHFAQEPRRIDESWFGVTVVTWMRGRASIPYVGVRAVALLPIRNVGKEAKYRFTLGPHVFVQRDLHTVTQFFDATADAAGKQLRIGGRFEVGIGCTIGIDFIPAK